MLTLSENEYTIMNVMWEAGHPVTRAEILNGTEGRNWNPASIHLILNSMISKGAIKITDENVRYGRSYEPCVSYDEYLIAFLKEKFPNKDMKQLLKDMTRVIRKMNKE